MTHAKYMAMLIQGLLVAAAAILAFFVIRDAL